jgi:hypothetical protein
VEASNASDKMEVGNMGEDFLSGNLYISDGESIHTLEGLSFACEIETDSVGEYAETLLRIPTLNSRASISYNITAVDLAVLNKLVQPLTSPETLWFESDTPIMIQSRWHKKKRINKKWLNRYGMKPDTVRVRKEGKVLTYNRDDGIEFETTNKNEYIWRQDQLHKHLKMEWL